MVSDGASEHCVGAAEVIEQVDSERTAVEQPMTSDAPIPSPTAEVVTGSVSMAAEPVERVPAQETIDALEEAGDADDLLDIPAFLRRQAN